jgi:hypothetical protein
MIPPIGHGGKSLALEPSIFQTIRHGSLSRSSGMTNVKVFAIRMTLTWSGNSIAAPVVERSRTVHGYLSPPYLAIAGNVYRHCLHLQNLLGCSMGDRGLSTIDNFSGIDARITHKIERIASIGHDVLLG